MDPFTMALIGAAAQAFIGAGIQAATPKYGMTQPGATPETGGGMDFSSMIAPQQESQLPKGRLHFDDPFNKYQTNN